MIVQINSILTRPGFTVDGKTLPGVHFDAGESYAGLLPVNSSVAKDDLQELYFWFFPSKAPPAEKEIVIWLTGGIRLLRFPCILVVLKTKS